MVWTGWLPCSDEMDVLVLVLMVDHYLGTERYCLGEQANGKGWLHIQNYRTWKGWWLGLIIHQISSTLGINTSAGTVLIKFWFSICIRLLIILLFSCLYLFILCWVPGNNTVETLWTYLTMVGLNSCGSRTEILMKYHEKLNSQLIIKLFIDAVISLGILTKTRSC